MTYLYTYIHSIQIIKQGERSISIYIDVKGLDIGRACMHPLFVYQIGCSRLPLIRCDKRSIVFSQAGAKGVIKTNNIWSHLDGKFPSVFR